MRKIGFEVTDEDDHYTVIHEKIGLHHIRWRKVLR